MISVVGIGNAACNRGELQITSNNYKVYQLGSSYKNTKYTRTLKSYDRPEKV